VGELQRCLSAQEFTRWCVWMDAEQQGPAWAAMRHAELMAAVHNGGGLRHADGRPFRVEDFMRTDPWHPPAVVVPAAMTPAQLAAQHAAWVAAQGG
jgi:hypothetical protein